jgi:peptidoglycan/xylan/chitin deacetylase (PgdA/CDA1 family)
VRHWKARANQTDNSARHVVLTFDDGYRNVVENALDLLAKNRFRAVQFLVANFLGKTNEWDLRVGEKPEPLMDGAQVRDWLAAGHEIGSHTLTHPRLTRLTLRDAKGGITASKKGLGTRWAGGSRISVIPTAIERAAWDLRSKRV